MTLLENDGFLVELNKLFQRARLGGPGAVYITMKNCKFGLALTSETESFR